MSTGEEAEGGGRTEWGRGCGGKYTVGDDKEEHMGCGGVVTYGSVRSTFAC